MLREIDYLLQRTTLERIAGTLKSEITLISPEVVLGSLCYTTACRLFAVR